jgi:hypothetical protein
MKQKRAKGGGRKPRGPFAHNTAQLTIRMPADMRTSLEAAAEKRGWNITQELLWRLRRSLNKDWEDDRRFPAVRALCFLIAELAEQVGLALPSDWHRDPFQFRAFRLGVAELLEALEPAGAMRSPYGPIDQALLEKAPVEFKSFVAHAMKPRIDSHKTPEATGHYGAQMTLHSLFHPDPVAESVYRGSKHPDPYVQGIVERHLHGLYGFANARKDIGIADKLMPIFDVGYRADDRTRGEILREFGLENNSDSK